jgi:hypothetical protein
LVAGSRSKTATRSASAAATSDGSPEGVGGELAGGHGPHLLVAQLARQLEGQGVGQIVMAEDHGVEQRGQGRLGLGGVFGLVTQRGPDGRRGFVRHDLEMLGHRVLPRLRRL